MREGSLERLLPVSAVEPDGLLVTRDGTYVRALRLASVAQPFRGGSDHRDEIRARFASLCARISAGQSLQLIVEAEPLDAGSALAADLAEIAAASDAADPSRGLAMRRLGAGLEQTLRRSIPSEAAVEMRWWAICPHRPRERGRARGGVRTLSPEAHLLAAERSAAYARLVAAELEAAGCEATELDGAGVLGLLRRWLCLPPASGLEAIPRVLETADVAEATSQGAAILGALTSGAELDLRSPELVRYSHAGVAERIAHLSSPPEHTSPWWLLYLMEAPPPWRLAVHIHATDRARQRRAYRLRRRRLWADVQRRHRSGKIVTPELEEAERESAEIDAELRLSSAGVYGVSAYLGLRAGGPAAEGYLAEAVKELSTELEGRSGARMYGGRFLAESSWSSLLPLGQDRLAATRRLSSRNVGDCVPLISARCGSPDGVPLGFAVPGRTLERIDLFDPRCRTHIGLITGSAGSGKTVAANALLARSIARGAVGWIIDRSSGADEASATREAGHYEALASLIPGARTIHFGAPRRDAHLCPWDVTDPASVPDQKLRFLVALHTLLLGDAPGSGAGGSERVLSGTQRALLERGIQAVYARCADSGERPRESLLREELLALARSEAAEANLDGDPAVASEFRRLAAQLHPYCEGGPHAWLCDAETTIPEEAPLLLCDLAGLHDDLAGPVMLSLVDHIERVVARRQAAHRRDPGSEAGPWAGRAFVAIDEAWAQLRVSRAAAGYLNEWGRRTRHMATALLIVTQHLSDFDTPEGRALLRNSVLRLFFRTATEEITYVREALGLTEADLEAITRELETRKGESSMCFVDSEARGRGRVKIVLGDIEYWICSSDPRRDAPIRARALRESGGDPWAALRLLVDPRWHEAHAQTKTHVPEAAAVSPAP